MDPRLKATAVRLKNVSCMALILPGFRCSSAFETRLGPGDRRNQPLIRPVADGYWDGYRNVSGEGRGRVP
jgi:hypothetical protein